MPTRIDLPAVQDIHRIPGLSLLSASISRYVGMADFGAKSLAVAFVFGAFIEGVEQAQISIRHGEEILLRLCHEGEIFDVCLTL